MGKLTVISPGIHSSIQDEGRFGFRKYGIPQSGAMDIQALHKANRLVSNPENFPAIEVSVNHIKLQASQKTSFAATGASALVTINQKAVNMYSSYQLSAGDELSVELKNEGMYTYLGIGGLIQANQDFNSFSTYLMGGFGGIDGGLLKKGDIIETEENNSFTKREENQYKHIEVDELEIRIMKGPEWFMLKDLPTRFSYKILPSSNRMGIRLSGPKLSVDGNEVISSAVIPGIIQLPGNGEPIILMNDCQTTGGYPRIGKVVDEDMGKLAQLRPGKKIRFVTV